MTAFIKRRRVGHKPTVNRSSSIECFGFCVLIATASCGKNVDLGNDFADTGETGTDTSTTMDETEGDSDSDTGETDDDTKFDLGEPDLPPDEPVCDAFEMGQPVPCDDEGPADSFSPQVQWSWDDDEGKTSSTATPLVANMTDDNDDGVIDMCDTPDVVAVVQANDNYGIVVLDGETGDLHFRIDEQVVPYSTPAIGDIDGDGEVEIVALLGPSITIGAWNADGTKLWEKPFEPPRSLFENAASIALADIDHDGDVEIATRNVLLDHEGETLWVADEPPLMWSATTIADLDGVGDMEIVMGNAAYYSDGTRYWLQDSVAQGFPQIGNFDDDDDPEIVLTTIDGLNMLEHDGTVIYQDLRPTGDPVGILKWMRPATIHDFDGDGQAEYASSSAEHYSVYESDASVVWSKPVLDASGLAAGTAFDFLGDGVAEAMYADEYSMFVFDGQTGDKLLETTRSSQTGTEYPVVADVDNDGSAEIVVVSNFYMGEKPPTIQVIRDAEDRWIQARRIWNQHTYHVTNVREDGQIPVDEKPSWELLNTFRTNAQIGAGGSVCIPEG